MNVLVWVWGNIYICLQRKHLDCKFIHVTNIEVKQSWAKQFQGFTVKLTLTFLIIHNFLYSQLIFFLFQEWEEGERESIPGTTGTCTKAKCIKPTRAKQETKTACPFPRLKKKQLFKTCSNYGCYINVAKGSLWNILANNRWRQVNQHTGSFLEANFTSRCFTEGW